MKRTVRILAMVVFFLSPGTQSCEDSEPFVRIKGIENSIYNEIKSYRESNEVTGNFVHQFVMVKEAQLISARIAQGDQTLDTTGISDHWAIIHDKIGGYNDLTLMQSTTETDPAAIVAAWTADSATNAMILGDFSQCGVGVEYDNANVAFVTVLMMLVD